MAAYGAADQAGQDRHARRSAYLKELLPSTSSVQDKSGREALQTFTRRQGRRAARLRERGDHRPAEGRGRRLRDPGPDTILIENPIAVTEGRQARGEGVRRLPATRTAAQKIFASSGYRPVIQAVARRARQVPRRRSSLFTIDDLGGWTRSTTQFFDPETRRRWRRSSRTWGSRLPRLSAAARPAARAGARAPSRRGRAGRAASSTVYLSVIVLLPLAAVVASRSTAASQLLGRGHVTARRSAALELTLGVVARRGRDQRRHRAR